MDKSEKTHRFESFEQLTFLNWKTLLLAVFFIYIFLPGWELEVSSEYLGVFLMNYLTTREIVKSN